MACTHPFGVESITRHDGVPGVRCPVCGMCSFKGDTWRDVLRGAWNALRGRKNA